jgi:predicted GIY-YIG superfamily endonuclease
MYLYRAYDHAGRLLYIGITYCIYGRIKAHRRTSAWYRDVQSWSVAELPAGWYTAHRAEIEAIKTEDPIHNVAHSPRWRKAHRGWLPVEIGAVA